MLARIYKPAKSAMQSGHANTQDWVLELSGKARRSKDPLMGWTSCDDTYGQVRMSFPTREKAITYAKANGLTFTVDEAPTRQRLIKSYSENFSADRKQPWTH